MSVFKKVRSQNSPLGAELLLVWRAFRSDNDISSANPVITGIQILSTSGRPSPAPIAGYFRLWGGL